MNNKIGVGIITCNRSDYFKQCLASIPAVDQIVVVNDGRPYKNPDLSNVNEYIQHPFSKSVGVAKNAAMRYLVQQDCDHIFLIEDDILVKDENVFDRYIKTAQESGIWHLLFANHGPANRDQNGKLTPRKIVEYDNGIEVALYKNCIGAFNYYYKGIIKNVGYHDEHFKNAFEHVELTYRIVEKGLHTPFWWFADVADSYNYLEEISGSTENRAIADSSDYAPNKKRLDEINKAGSWFVHKHGKYVTQIPDSSEADVLARLEFLQKNYARKS